MVGFMGETSPSKWFPRMGSTESGEPIINLLLDEAVDSLRLELEDFPAYLLCQQKDGPERGTLLQIAVRRGQALTVTAIVQKLIDLFERAKTNSASQSSGDSLCDFVHRVNDRINPRLISEDPMGVGSLSGLMRSLGSDRRQAVALALLPSCPYFDDPIERALIGMYADSPDIALSPEALWSPLEKLLLSMEFDAKKCYEAACLELEGNLDEMELLHEAARRDFTGALRWLVDSGLDPNDRDSSGCTPLHVAAEAGRTRSVQALLQLGSSPRVENLMGDIAMISAIKASAKDCAMMLVESTDATDTDITEKALFVAIQSDMFDLASSLLRLQPDRSHPGALPAERLLTDVIVSVEACRWLFALLVPILSSVEHSETEIMPLLTLEDFQFASRVAGLDCDSAEMAIDQFLKTIASKVGLHEWLHRSETVYGAPLCLLFCASSLALAITKENNSFHQLHPQMRSLFGKGYEDSHLGEAWQNLRAWMELRGLVLAWPQDTWLRNVGPPLYHAIWRPDDREKLFEALGSLGVNTLIPITTAEMDVFLRRKIDMFSVHIRNMLASDTDRDAVLRSACSNLSVSRVVRSSRARSVQSRDPYATLSWRRDLRTRRISVQATLPWREGMPESISFAESNEYLSNGETYQRVTLEASWVENDRIVSREGYTFRIPSITEPLVFSVSGDRSQRYSLTVGEGQLVICPIHLKDSILAFLAQVQNDEVKVTQIERFPELVALGPVIPLHEVSGCLMMSERQRVHGELVGGLRFRGTAYHHLALPCVVLQGFVLGEECSWMVDGNVKPAEAIFDEDSQVLVYPPTGGVHYCLQVSGKAVAGTRFDAAQSVNECREEEPRNRWPLLLPERGEFDILGVSGVEVVKVRLTRKSGLLTVPFEPCWAIDVKARPLTALIPHPDEIAFSPTTSDRVKHVPQASAGDAMSQNASQQCWEFYLSKARQ